MALRVLVVILLVAVPAVAQAQTQTITASWDANTDPLTTGYRVYYGTSPTGLTINVDAGNTTSSPLSLAIGATYYVEVRAYNAIGELGPPSDQASITIGGPVPPTATFSGSLSGGNASLTWVTTDATSVTINGAAVALSGSTQYPIATTTIYTLIATGPGGSVTRTATVTVPVVDCVVSAWVLQSATAWGTCTAGSQTRSETWVRSVVTPASGGGAACGPLSELRTGTQACAMPPTATFSGSLSGANAALTWTTTGATAVTINGAAVALSGSASYPISVTTTYTLIATGPGGSVTRTATVTVPVVDCVVSAWTMQSATAWGACTASQQTRTETWTRTVVTPASGGGAACGPLSEQRTGTQACAMPPTATFSGSLSGGNAALTWTTTGATAVTINGAAVALSGSASYPISVTTTYTLIATGPGGSVTRTATVTVPVVDCVVSAWTMQSATAWGACTASQQTRTETWTRTVVTPASGGGAACGPLSEQRTGTQACAMPPTATFSGSLSGGNAALTWTTTGATAVTINGAAVALSGSASYPISVTTTYTLIATGPGGSVTRTATVTVPVVDCVVSAWTMQSATAWGACTASQQTRSETWTRTVVTPASGGGAACGPLTEQRTGTQSCAMPPTATFSGSLSGGNAALTWTTTGAIAVTINGAAVALSGSASYPISVTTTYTLIATGPGGSVTRTATVTVPVVDCVVSAWTMQSATAWGACTASQQTRSETWTRTVVTPASGGGAACGPLTEQRTGTQSCAMPPTATFSGSLSGANAALTWTTTGATAVTINGAAVALSGSASYPISVTTTYTLIATGPGGSVTRTATVTVPVVDCVVSAWTMQSATAWGACTASQQTRTETWTRTVVTPASGGGAACGPLSEQRTGTQSCSMPPTATFSGSLNGGNAALTWTTSGATAVTVNGAAVALSGSASYPISATTTYTLIATGPGGSVTRTTTVTVPVVDCVVSAWTMESATAWGTCTASQQTRSETWTRTVVTPASGGGAACGPLSEQRTGTQSCAMPPTATFAGTFSDPHTANLTWTTTGATAVTINGAAVALSGSTQYAITTATTYTLVATGPGGSVTRTATVTPSTSPVDCVVSAWAMQSATAWSACSAGQQTRTETWTRSVVTPASGGGAACGPLSEQRTGTQSCAMPPTATFTGTLSGASTADLTWTTTGATAVTINGVAVALSGSTQYVITTATTYTLVATGPGGSVTRTATVTPSPAPVDCVVSAWSLYTTTSWSVCSGGQQSRTETWRRTIITPAANGGLACGPLQEDRVATQTCVAAPTAPGTPVNMRATVSGNTVTLSWSPDPNGGAPAAYFVSAGTAPGSADVTASQQVGAATTVSATLSRGQYYARVKAANSLGVSSDSPDVSFVIGEKKPPRKPRGLTGSLESGVATLTWLEPAADGGQGEPSGYIIEAGSGPGMANLANLAVNSNTFQAGSVPPGIYHVRVRAVNDQGVSEPSEEIVLRSGAAIGAPSALTSSGVGSIVELNWQAPSGGEVPSGYLIEAGSGSGRADLAALRVGNAVTFATTAPPGTYYVRVRAIAADGTAGEASNEIIVRR